MSSTNSGGFLHEAIEQVQRYRLKHIEDAIGYGEMPHQVFLSSMFDKDKQLYKAFCSGNIISSVKLLTSARCFLTNKKKFRRELESVDVVGGSLSVFTKKNAHENQQWRKITKIHSQKYYRFPAYSLAVLIIDKPWSFNMFVNFIPIPSINANFDGVCFSAKVRTTTAWASTRVLFKEQVKVIKQSKCETILQRNCKIFYCTATHGEDTLTAIETEGGGLVCHGTGDPEEKDDRGLLVGVTTLINIKLPTLHNRIGVFRKWINDSATSTYIQQEIVILLAIICCIHVGLSNLMQRC